MEMPFLVKMIFMTSSVGIHMPFYGVILTYSSTQTFCKSESGSWHPFHVGKSLVLSKHLHLKQVRLLSGPFSLFLNTSEIP